MDNSSIVGVTVPVIDLTLTLPTQRKDGSPLAPSDIHSAILMRDSGHGPITVKEIAGPFTSPTVQFSDTSPATGHDIYSFVVTDNTGIKSDKSNPVTVTVHGKAASAPAAGVLTAIEKPNPLTKPAVIQPPVATPEYGYVAESDRDRVEQAEPGVDDEYKAEPKSEYKPEPRSTRSDPRSR